VAGAVRAAGAVFMYTVDRTGTSVRITIE